MPKAEHETTTTAAPIISGQIAVNLADTIARLKQIAANSQDRLYLSDGPPHPDHALLDAAGDALRLMRMEREMRNEDHGLFGGDFANLSDAEQDRRRTCSRENLKEIGKVSGAFRTAMHLVRKAKANTPAGVYAKALVCRQSQSGAAIVAMSLAEGLVENSALRASIWPSNRAAA